MIVAGTWFDQIARLNSWWKIEGQWVSGRDEASGTRGWQRFRRLHGRQGSGKSARPRAVATDTAIRRPRSFAYRKRHCHSGGSEDSQVFVELGVAQSLAALGGRIGLVQISVRGSAPAIENVMQQLAQALPGLSVLPVRQLAAAEGRLLERIRGLLLATVFLILLLTALGVLAAMAGWPSSAAAT